MNVVLDLDVLRRIASHREARSMLSAFVACYFVGRNQKATAQLVFPFGLPASARGAISEGDVVACDHFRCTALPARACLMRQAANWPGKKASVFAYCGSGECNQGADYMRRADFDVRALWSKGRYSFYRRDSKEQHAARKRLAADGTLARRREEWTDAAELVMLNQGAATATPRRG